MPVRAHLINNIIGYNMNNKPFAISVAVLPLILIVLTSGILLPLQIVFFGLLFILSIFATIILGSFWIDCITYAFTKSWPSESVCRNFANYIKWKFFIDHKSPEWREKFWSYYILKTDKYPEEYV